MIRTDIDEFRKFHELLTVEHTGYQPWYFVLEKNDKDPETIRGSWKAAKAKLTFDEAVRWLEKGHNIGIAATNMDPLVIIDIDDIEITPDSVMKPTLSVRSRKRIGRHYYYFTNDAAAKTNIATENEGEIRANWQYVVAPGSYVPGETEKMPDDQKEFAGHYTIENTIPPTDISYKEFPGVFLDQIEKNKEIEKEKRKREREKRQRTKQQKNQPTQRKNNSAIFDLTIEDVIGAIPDQSRFPSLFHGSDTGKNTSVSDGLLQCWRHNVSHTPLSALAVMAGIADCVDAGQSHATGGSGSSCLDYEDGRTIFNIWRFAKKEGMIPKDDPMPTNALVWYAVDQGVCKSDEIEDGWRIPAKAYNQVISLFDEEEGMPAGREKANTNEHDTRLPVSEPEMLKPIPNSFVVKFPPAFRELMKEYPDIVMTSIDVPGELAYQCDNEEFIEKASNLKIIEVIESGTVVFITEPLQITSYITKIERAISDESFLSIDINNHKKRIQVKDIFDLQVWKPLLIDCNILIGFDLRSSKSKIDFNYFLKWLFDNVTITTIIEESEEDMVRTMIVGEVVKLVVVNNNTSFRMNPATCMINDKGERLVKVDTLHTILRNKNLNITLPTLRIVLEPVLTRNSKQVRIDGPRMSIWFFDNADICGDV